MKKGLSSNKLLKQVVMLFLVVSMIFSTFSVSFAVEPPAITEPTQAENVDGPKNEADEDVETGLGANTQIEQSETKTDSIQLQEQIKIDFVLESVTGLSPDVRYEYSVDNNSGPYTAVTAGVESFEISSVITTASRKIYVRVVGAQPEDAREIIVPTRPEAPSLSYETPAAGQLVIKSDSEIEYRYKTTDSWTPGSGAGIQIDFSDAQYDYKYFYARTKATDDAFSSKLFSGFLYIPTNTLSYDAATKRVNYGKSYNYTFYSIDGGGWKTGGMSSYLDVATYLSAESQVSIRLKIFDTNTSAYQEIMLSKLNQAPRISIDFANETLTGFDPTMQYQYSFTENGTYTNIPRGATFPITSLITSSPRIMYIRSSGSAIAQVSIPARPATPPVPQLDFPSAGKIYIQGNSNIEYCYDNNFGPWLVLSDEANEEVIFTQAENVRGARNIYYRAKATDASFASTAIGFTVNRMSDTLTYNPSMHRVSYAPVNSATNIYYSINLGDWILAGQGAEYIDISEFLSADGPLTVRVKCYDTKFCAYREIIIPKLDAAPEGISIDFMNETLTGFDPTMQYQYSFKENGTYTNIPKGETFQIAGFISSSPRIMYIRLGDSATAQINIPAKIAAPAAPQLDFPAAGRATFKGEPGMEYSYTNSAPWTAFSGEEEEFIFTHSEGVSGNRSLFYRSKGTDSSFASQSGNLQVYRMADTVSYDASLRRVNLGTRAENVYYSVNGGSWGKPISSSLTYIDVDYLLSTTRETVIRVKYNSPNGAYREVAIPKLELAPNVSIDFKNERLAGLEPEIQYQYSLNGFAPYTDISKGSNFSITNLIKTSQQAIYVRAIGSQEKKIMIPTRPAAPPFFPQFDFSVAGKAFIIGDSSLEYRYDNDNATGVWTALFDGRDAEVVFTQAENVTTYRVVYHRLKATDSAFASLASGIYVHRMSDTLSYNVSSRRVMLGPAPINADYSVNGGPWRSASNFIDASSFLSTEGPTVVRIRQSVISVQREITIPKLDKAPEGLAIDFVNETLTGLDPVVQYQYSFTEFGTYTYIPRAATFSIAGLISGSERTIYVRTNDSAATAIIIPERNISPPPQFDYSIEGKVYIQGNSKLEYRYDNNSGPWTALTDDMEEEVVFTQAQNVLGTRDIYYRTKATETSFASASMYTNVSRMPNTLSYDAALRKINFGMSSSYMFYSLNGGEWIMLSGVSSNLDASSFLSADGTTSIRVKYTGNGAYREIILPKLDEAPQNISIDFSNETLKGFDSSVQYQYSLTENGGYTNIPKGTTFSIAGFIANSERTMYVRATDSSAASVVIPTRPGASIIPQFAYPSAGKIYIIGNSDLEYRYDSASGAMQTLPNGSNEEIIFTQTENALGARNIYYRTKATETTFASATVGLTVYRMPNTLSYDASLRRVNFTSSYNMFYSVNGGDWIPMAGAVANLDISPFLSLERATSIRLKNMVNGAYREVVIPKLDKAPEGISIDFQNEALTGFNPDVQYAYSFAENGTYTNIPKGTTFSLAGLIANVERTMYIRTTNSAAAPVAIPARPAEPAYRTVTPDQDQLTILIDGEAECAYRFDSSAGEYTAYPAEGIDVAWTQASNAVGSRNVYFKSLATETQFASYTGSGTFYRMPNTLHFAGGTVKYTTNNSIPINYAYFSVDGGNWIPNNTADKYYVDVTSFMTSHSAIKVRVKYNLNSAYREVEVPTLPASYYSIDYEKQEITGLSSLTQYYYRYEGESAWKVLPAKITTYPYADLLGAKNRVVIHLKAGVSILPSYVVLQTKRPAPAKPVIDFPQAGKAVIRVDSNYEYKYYGEDVWKTCLDSGIDVQWTHNLAQPGGRTVTIRLKGTQTDIPSQSLALTVNRMVDVTYNAEEGVLYFVNEKISTPAASINGGEWDVFKASMRPCMAINKYALKSEQNNIIKVKYGDVDSCAYAEVSVPATHNNLDTMPELPYSLPADKTNVEAYDLFQSTLTGVNNTAYFRFVKDASNSNPVFVMLDDQAPTVLDITFYDANNEKVSGEFVQSFPSGSVYKTPDDLPDGVYYARLKVYDPSSGFSTTNIKVLYTDAERAAYFQGGPQFAAYLGRYNPNIAENFSARTLVDRNEQHWYKVYFTKNGIQPDIVTLTTKGARVDFTIRGLDNPEKILYESFRDPTANRLTFKGANKSVIKHDWDPPSTDYYYVVVQAKNDVYNEAYRLTVGNPETSNGQINLAGGSMNITRAGVYYFYTLNANASSIPNTAKVRYISGQSNSINGYANIEAKKSTEVEYHTGSAYWDYVYASGWSNNMVPVRGTWDYRAMVTSSSRVPISFQPVISVNYIYEIGD